MIAIFEANIKKICAMRRALQSVGLENKMVYFDSAPYMLHWLDENIGEIRIICLGSSQRDPWYHGKQLLHSGTGMDVIKGLRQYQPDCSVLIHSDDKRYNADLGIELACQGINSRVVHRRAKNWIEEEWLPEIVRTLGLNTLPLLSKTAN